MSPLKFSNQLWYRPRLYWTIVALYLLLVSAAGIAYVAFTIYMLYLNMTNVTHTERLSFAFAIDFVIIIFLIPILIAATKLLKASKDSVFISLMVLIIIATSLAIATLTSLIDIGISLEQLGATSTLLATTLAMFPCLLLKRKEIKASESGLPT